jgi:hypothetical protein
MTSEEPHTPRPTRLTPQPLSQGDISLRKGFSFALILLLLSIGYPFTPLTWAAPHGGHGAHLADLFCGDLLLACACYFHYQIASLDHSVVVQFPSLGFSRTIIRDGYVTQTDPFVPSWLWHVERDFWLFGLAEGAVLWYAYAYCHPREDIRRWISVVAVALSWYVGWSATPQGRKDWAWRQVREFWFWMAASRIFRGGWVGVKSFGNVRF